MKRYFLGSLHLKIATGVTLTVLCLSGVYLFFHYRSHRVQAFEELHSSADELASLTLQGLLELAMVGGHPELFHQAIEELGDKDYVTRIRLTDRTGRIRFASDLTDVGRQLNRLSPGCIECHRSQSPPAQTSIVLTEGSQELLRHVSSIPNRTECRRCHGTEKDSLGLLIIDLPTTEVHRKLAAAVWELALHAGLMVGGILLVLAILMNRLVISPINLLSETARRIRDEDFSARADIGSSDELGSLAQTLNHTARGLAQYRREVAAKEQARERLVAKLVETLELERQCLARELHDELGQSLSAILLEVHNGCRFASLEENHCRQIESRIRDIIDDVHRLAKGMRPPILDDYGLESALSQHLKEVSSQTGLEIDYQYTASADLDRLPDTVELTLYRVAQEAVNNIVRHAEARRASLIVLHRTEEVTMLVEDEGLGFDVDRVKKEQNGGLGLVGIRERVGLFGGICTIESVPQSGTTIRVQIPLN